MKKFVLGLLVLFLGVLAVQASALAVPFTDYLLVEPQMYMNPGDSVSFIFDLDNDFFTVGDVNAEDSINWAYLDVLIDDDYEPLSDYSDLDYLDLEFAVVDVDGVMKISEEVNYGTYSANINSQVIDDHIANITVFCDSGDFYLNGLRIRGDYTDNPSSSPAPEPATMLLFGPALLGLVGLRRRKS